MIPGCGWDNECDDPQPTTTNEVPCVAKSGYKPPHLAKGDWTVGHVGLCVTCLEQPADLLHRLSRATIHQEPQAATTGDND